VAVAWVVDHQALEVTAYSVGAVDGDPIPQAIRRRLDAALEDIAMKMHARQAALVAVKELGDGTLTLGEGTASTSVTVRDVHVNQYDNAVERDVFNHLQAQRRRRYIDHELLERVAKTYTAAGGQAPTKAVQESEGVSKAQASRYVKAARDAGYLAPLPVAKD
jgi:hypothetical protein